MRNTVSRGVEFFGGVVIGIVIGVVVCICMTVAIAGSTGILWHWEVRKDHEVVCTSPWVWSEIKLIECGES